MEFTKKEYKQSNKRDYRQLILAGDIGGTNCSLGIFGIKNRPELIVSFHFKSRQLKDLYGPINLVLEYAKRRFGIKIEKCCLGIAGILSAKKDYVHLTNANLDLSMKSLSNRTALKKIILMNDFEAAGYGVNVLKSRDIKTIQKGFKIPNAPIVVIGAGTGLGKATLIYDNGRKMHIPLASEIHHADFPAQNKIEMELVDFIKKYRKIKNVSNGDILSGDGLENIYLFLRKSGRFKQSEFTREIDMAKSRPELISKYRKKEIACRKAFEIFKSAYAGFSKGCALDSLSFGGVYIFGGIAIKNPGIFDGEFMKEFRKSHKMEKILQKIPVYLVLNPDAGLLGAGFAGAVMK